MESSWAYGAFVAPLIALAVGLGARQRPGLGGLDRVGPADQVGAASGISNMARYIGAAVAVAAIAMIYNAVAVNHPTPASRPATRWPPASRGRVADDGDLVCRRRRALACCARHSPRRCGRRPRRGRRVDHHTIPIAPAVESPD